MERKTIGRVASKGITKVPKSRYQDWADYLQHGSRVDANFRSVVAELRRSPLSFEARVPLD